MKLNKEASKDALPHEGTVATKLDINEAIDRVGDGRLQRWILIANGLAFGSDASEIMLLSFLTTVLQAQWGLSNTETAALFSSVFGGQLIGSVILGPLADRFGRRPMFLVTASIITVFGFLTALANDLGTLVALRMLVGFGIGGIMISFDSLAEFLPRRRRGKGLIMIEYFWTLGELLVILFAYLTLGTSGNADTNPNAWRLFVILSAIPVLVSVVLGYCVVPESPRWLVSRGKQDQALAVLRKAATINQKDPHALFPEGTVLTDVHQPQCCEIGYLFKPKWRKITLLTWVVWFGWGLTYFGIVQLTTDVFSTVSGPDAADINSYTFDYGPILISSLSEIAGTTAVLFAIDPVGRVGTQAITYVLGGLFTMVFAALATDKGSTGGSIASQGVLTTFSFFARMMYMGGCSATYVATAELFPTGLRTTGHSSANFMARVGAFASPYLVDEVRQYYVTGIIMLVLSLVTATAAFNLPETSNRVKLGMAFESDEQSLATTESDADDEVGGDAEASPQR